jgi:hypothetical protein
MLYINSVSVSAPHNDIEHMKIANLNRRSLAVQPGGELRGRPCPHRRRRINGAVNAGIRGSRTA